MKSKTRKGNVQTANASPKTKERASGLQGRNEETMWKGKSQLQNQLGWIRPILPHPVDD